MFLPCISTLSLFWFMIRLNELMPVLQISGWTYPYNAPHEKPGRCIQPTSTTTHEMVDWWNILCQRIKAEKKKEQAWLKGQTEAPPVRWGRNRWFLMWFSVFGLASTNQKAQGKEAKKRRGTSAAVFHPGGSGKSNSEGPENIDKIYLEPDGYQFINDWLSIGWFRLI